MRNLLFICLFLCSLSCKAQLNPQSKKVTEKFFPDPDIEINTPAFQKKKGYTTYEEMIAFLEARQQQFPELTKLSYVGQSQQGKEIPLIVLDKKNSNEKLKVWIQAGLHGDEMGSTEGALFLLDELLNNKQYQYLLEYLTIGILPMANIDGYEKQSRYAANGLDLNRDQTKLNVQESVFLKQAFNAFEPEVALDFHEYRPYRRDFSKLSTYGISFIYDVMFLYSGNLNVPENLRVLTKEKFVSNAEKVLSANQLTHHDYITSTKIMGAIQFNQGATSARSSASSFALTNCISTLVEVRGVGIGETSFKRRVNSVLIVAISYLNSAYENRGLVKSEIAKAKKSKHDATVVFEKSIYRDHIQVIDLDKNEEIKFEITVRDALKSIAKLTRIRPNAYLINPNENEVVERLQTLGLQLDTLKKEIEIEVEYYTINEYERNNEKYEGVFIQNVKTDVKVMVKTLPAGTFVLSMNQAKANLAFEVLEPEANNSFVSFSVLPTELGAELPIYRYLKDKTLIP